MFLGTILVCASLSVESCSLFVNTEELYISEQACVVDSENVANSMQAATGYLALPKCFRLNSVGEPL
jgi:hypothetical protein